MSATKYILEICPPAAYESIASFESDTPFGGISKGNYLGRALLPGGMISDNYIVKEVQHFVYQAPEQPVTHKIMIYTEEVSVEEFEKRVGI